MLNGSKNEGIKKLEKRLEQIFRKRLGVGLDFINSHSMWELEELTKIGHYKYDGNYDSTTISDW